MNNVRVGRLFDFCHGLDSVGGVLRGGRRGASRKGLWVAFVALRDGGNKAGEGGRWGSHRGDQLETRTWTWTRKGAASAHKAQALEVLLRGLIMCTHKCYPGGTPHDMSGMTRMGFLYLIVATAYWRWCMAMGHDEVIQRVKLLEPYDTKTLTDQQLRHLLPLRNVQASESSVLIKHSHNDTVLYCR